MLYCIKTVKKKLENNKWQQIDIFILTFLRQNIISNTQFQVFVHSGPHLDSAHTHAFHFSMCYFKVPVSVSKDIFSKRSGQYFLIAKHQCAIRMPK